MVISNCVINLAPDKQAVFREIARVLKTVADWLSATSLLPAAAPEMARDWMAYVGCIAGAISIEDYQSAE